MAKRFPSQNSLVVDRAAIELDSETGKLRVILQDEELAVGLVLNVPSGGKMETTLLSLFNAPTDLGGANNTVPPQQDVAPSNPTVPAVSATVVPVVPVIKPEAVAVKDLTVKETKTDDEAFIKPHGKIPTLDLTKKGNLVTVSSPRENTSKTTASFMLGVALARTPQILASENPLKVAVVDLDVINGTLYSIVPPKAKGSMGVYESGVINIDNLVKNMTHAEDLGVHLLPISNEKWNALDWLGTDFLTRTIEVLQENFDVVIVDTPARDFSYITQEALSVADVNIITNTIERRQETPTRQWLQKHFRFRRVAERAAVLLTNTPKAQVLGSWENVKQTHTPIGIVGNIPMDSVGFLAALKNNQVSTLYKTGNAVTDAYDVLADRLLGV